MEEREIYKVNDNPMCLVKSGDGYVYADENNILMMTYNRKRAGEFPLSEARILAERLQDVGFDVEILIPVE